MGAELDKLDVELLKLVQLDAFQTANALGEKVGLSPSSALRRVNRMRESGVIARECAILSEAFSSSRVFGLVMVQMNRHSPEVVAALKRQLVERPQIQLMFEISGAFDLALLAVERSLASFVEFTDKVLAVSPYVSRFETHFVKSRLKASLALPLDHRDVVR
jgi:Lrp/AsnC family leucine-responsive transcriptional regulator